METAISYRCVSAVPCDQVLRTGIKIVGPFPRPLLCSDAEEVIIEIQSSRGDFVPCVHEVRDALSSTTDVREAVEKLTRRAPIRPLSLSRLVP